MVSFINTIQTFTGQYVEGFCLSTDTKPTDGIANGSKMEVLNAGTGVITEYRFNEAAGAWVEIVAASDDA